MSASQFAEGFQRSLLNRFITTKINADTLQTIRRVFESQIMVYQRQTKEFQGKLTCLVEEKTEQIQLITRTSDETQDIEQSGLSISCQYKRVTDKPVTNSQYQLSVSHSDVDYKISLTCCISSESDSPEIAAFFEALAQQSVFYKAVWAFASQRKLPYLISDYHKTLDWRRLFSSYWSAQFLDAYVERVKVLHYFSADASAYADAVNPLLLAIWQQWRLRRSANLKTNLWDSVKALIDPLASENGADFSGRDLHNDPFGLRYNNVDLLLTLASLFRFLQAIPDSLARHRCSPSEDLIASFPSKGLANNQRFTRMLAFCMLVNHRQDSYGKYIIKHQEVKRFVLQEMCVVCKRYLEKQHIVLPQSDQPFDNVMRRLSRANLYIWLIYSVLTHNPEQQGDDTAKQQITCNTAINKIINEGNLFQDLCFLAEKTGRFMLFYSGDYPFEGKPIELAKTLIRVIDFHAKYVLDTNLPSSLMQLLVDSIESEHKFSQLKDASQHVQHLSDLYIFGQYLASEDFKLKSRARVQLSNTSIKQAYAIAALFHDIGMLDGMEKSNIDWPKALEKDAYIAKFQTIKFIDATEAEDIHTYEYFPFQEHAFTSATLVHQEVNLFNKHITKAKRKPLKMEHPIKPAIRAILFHSMCYLPNPDKDPEGSSNFVAMLLGMTDAVFTWRPSMTSIGNSRNLMCRGFGPALQADLARYDDKQLKIIGDAIFIISDSAIGESLQYVLKLIQSFGRLSFEAKQWQPVILLEVVDKALLKKELAMLTECIYHEVCSGINAWLEQQQQFEHYLNAYLENTHTEIKTPLRLHGLEGARSDEIEGLLQNTIYIESNNKILGNYDVIKFMQLPQIKDFIRHRSKFH